MSASRKHYGVIFRNNGDIEVLPGVNTGRFGGATKALNQANNKCQPSDTYTAVEADSYDEAVRKAQEFPR